MAVTASGHSWISSKIFKEVDFYKMLEMRPSEFSNGTGLADLPSTSHKQCFLMLGIEISQIVVDFTLNHQYFRFSNLKITNFVHFSNYFSNAFVRFSNFYKPSSFIFLEMVFMRTLLSSWSFRSSWWISAMRSAKSTPSSSTGATPT